MFTNRLRTLLLLTLWLAIAAFSPQAQAREVQVQHKATPHGTYADLDITLDQVSSPFIVLCAKPWTIKEGYYPKGTQLPPSCAEGQGVWGYVSVGKSQNHKVRIFDPQKPLMLQPGTDYYYVIQVNDGQNNKTVKTGAFKTKLRSAIVYITSIQVLNDSDVSGSGELFFTFFLDEKFMIKVPTNTEHYSWSTGQIPLPLEIKLFPKPGLEKTRLYVTGYDDDRDLGDKIGFDSCSPPKAFEKSPNQGTGGNTCYEFTSESKVLRLVDSKSAGPNEETKLPFTIYANPEGNSSLQFTVEGYVRILYV